MMARLFRIVILMLALAIYWQWNHPAAGIWLIFLRERNLATANAVYLLSALGLLGSAVLIAAAVRAITDKPPKLERGARPPFDR
jgi:hypothetical protein